MAGLLGFLAAGAVKGVGDGIVAEAKNRRSAMVEEALAKREAALATLQHSRTMERDQAAREFDRSERLAGEQFKAREGALDRADTAAQRRLASAKEAAKAPDVSEFYDEAGQPYKATWNTDTQSWDKVGGSKAPSNSNGVTIGPDGTVQIGGGGGVKVPANFMPDPDNPGGVKPIPGGPGEQLPAELAGRIAIADSFLGQAPDIRKSLESGAATGWYDRAQAGNNASSEQAAVFRQMQSGADALQRLLTGAGMTENEAKIYAARYLPSYTDDAASAVEKLDQMEREITNARAAALRGRGGTDATVTPNGPGTGGGNTDSPPPSNDYRKRYGLE